MAKPFIGQRVADRHGNYGTITFIKGHIADVDWDDGTQSKVAVGSLHQPGNVDRIRLMSLMLTVVAGLLALAAVLGLVAR